MKMQKNKKLLFFLFAAVILAVPLYLMLRSETILSEGTLYKFKLAAYDPFDPFKGKYLRLNYDTRNIDCPEGLSRDDMVYITIAEDKEGFAYFDEIITHKPSSGDYLHTRIVYNFGENCDITIPDDMGRYFINEDKAAYAEDILIDMRDSCYVKVRVLDGELRLEDIIIGKEKAPLHEYLETYSKEKNYR